MEAISPYCTLLVATDGSPESRRAAAHAIYLARALSARLIVLSVVDTHRAQSLGIYYKEAVQELAKDAKAAVAEAMAMAREAGVEAEEVLVEGNPGPQICRAAADRGADLVVVGATGKTGLQEILLGSVSAYVADHAKRPVLVVRG
jgi:nucleotide-binding universal stress UspA family protein